MTSRHRLRQVPKKNVPQDHPYDTTTNTAPEAKAASASKRHDSAAPPPFRAMAFGRNYFHCLGGMVPVVVAANSETDQEWQDRKQIRN